MFDAAIPSQVDTRAYQGLLRNGPYSSDAVTLGDKSLLFIFPSSRRETVRQFARELIVQGRGTYPGFQRMFACRSRTRAAPQSDTTPRGAIKGTMIMS